jgi:uncharacterized protein YcaQ
MAKRQKSAQPSDRLSLSGREARAIILRAQGFGAANLTHPVDVLDRLGVLQLDSVNVLARPHDLAPFGRLGQTSIPAMHHAIYEEKRGFEYWGHEASWLPIDLYRYFKPRMARWRDRWADVRAEHRELYGPLLERIRVEGPLGAADFEDPRLSRGSWWNWKPAKFVLEDLFGTGELMCRERRPGFARRYDLPERVLPAGLDLSDPGADVANRHLLLRAIGALGVATAADAIDYYRLPKTEAPHQLRELVESGAVREVEVEGWKATAFVWSDVPVGSTALPDHRPTFLSPFDNLIWYRDRVERVFGFHYRIEIYVPQGRRTFGYYVLPLLVDGDLIGRADLKLDRKAQVLLVKALWLDQPRVDAAAAALQDLAAHLGARTITVERVEPPELRMALLGRLGRGFTEGNIGSRI